MFGRELVEANDMTRSKRGRNDAFDAMLDLSYTAKVRDMLFTQLCTSHASNLMNASITGKYPAFAPPV